MAPSGVPPRRSAPSAHVILMNTPRPTPSAPVTLRAFIAASALTTAAAAYAQTPPAPGYGIGDAMKEAQPPRPPAPREAPVPSIEQQQDERPMALPAGETLTVHAFRFEGADFIPEAELQAAVGPYTGRALTLGEIEAAAARITALYRERGYLVARAYVPRQDASEGTLTLRVLVGRYGRFTFRNESLVRDGLVQGAFAGVQGDEAITRDGLERAMLIVADMPGAQLPRLRIAPGQAQGSSDLDVEVDADPTVAGYLLADNQGSRYTGKNRLRAGLDVNSPLGIADRLSLSGTRAQGEGLVNGRLAYGVPLMANGLRAEIAVSKTTYELGDDYEELEATGTAHTVEAGLSYPVVRSRGQNLSLGFSLAAKRMRDEIDALDTAIPKKAKVGTLTLQHEAWGSLLGRQGYSSVTAGLAYGYLDITDAAQKALNAAGADTVGHYGRFNLGLNGSLSLGGDWSLSASLGLQKALRDKNLDTSEQMTISGSNGVKAYRETVSGDNGYLLGAELRYLLPAVAGLTHSVGLFADTGRIHQQKADYTDTNGVRLSDVGLGYYASYRSLFGGVQVARGVGARPDAVARDDRTRVLLQLGMVF